MSRNELESLPSGFLSSKIDELNAERSALFDALATAEGANLEAEQSVRTAERDTDVGAGKALGPPRIDDRRVCGGTVELVSDPGPFVFDDRQRLSREVFAGLVAVDVHNDQTTAAITVARRWCHDVVRAAQDIELGNPTDDALWPAVYVPVVELFTSR